MMEKCELTGGFLIRACGISLAGRQVHRRDRSSASQASLATKIKPDGAFVQLLFVLDGTVAYRIVSYGMYCIVLYCFGIALHCIALHCIDPPLRGSSRPLLCLNALCIVWEQFLESVIAFLRTCFYAKAKRANPRAFTHRPLACCAFQHLNGPCIPSRMRASGKA